MTNTNELILALIKNKHSMKKICEELGISEKQFYVRLKQIVKYGYQLTPNYQYNSDIYYDLSNKMIPNSNQTKINIDKSEKEFRCLVISDAHIGNIDSDFKLLNQVYDYAVKNGINIILTCGDMIEGIHSTDKKKIYNLYSQVEAYIKKYPYDKNITNFGILGNHEYHFFHYDGMDVLNWLKDARHDMVFLGYGDGILKIRDESILLHHYLSFIDNKTVEEVNSDAKLVLSGHGHMMKTRIYNSFVLCVPTISRVSTNKKIDMIPGFIDMRIYLSKGKFDILEAKHMMMMPEIYQASETRCNFKGLIMSNNSAINKGKK